MTNPNLLEHYKKLEELMGDCYEKYKNLMTDNEKEECEEYLYTQGEYGLALESLVAILKVYKVDDKECGDKLEEARKLMELDKE